MLKAVIDGGTVRVFLIKFGVEKQTLWEIPSDSFLNVNSSFPHIKWRTLGLYRNNNILCHCHVVFEQLVL